MANKIVIEGSTVSASQLKEFFDQIASGRLNGDHMQAVIEHRDPFERCGLSETLARLKDAGYLDTSFEGKETHSLSMRALSKEEVFAEYRKSGGETWVWDELEKNMPYAMPRAEALDVMIMDFNKDIKSDDALKEMDGLGVRPLTHVELIQYGIAHPDHQKQKVLVGLGTKYTLGGGSLAPVLSVNCDERKFNAGLWGNEWGDRYRFPVVRK